MPVKGRLGDRKDATLDLTDRKLTVVVKGGFFGGKTSNTTISLDEVTAIEHGTGIKPFPDALMVKILYPEGELSFFSINKTPLQKLAEEAEAYVKKRATLLVEMEKEYSRDREAHVALLYLNLEFVDALMELSILLQGSIDWMRVEEQYHQVKHVNQDRDNLSLMRPAHLSLTRLGTGIEQRDVEMIKSEIYDLLFVLHEGCAEKAKHKEPWFNSQLHILFIDYLMAVWSKRLEAITSESSGESTESSEMRLQDLNKLMQRELRDPEAKRLISEQGFKDNHIVLFEWVEGLQNIGFEPGDELEKRLAA